MVLVDAGLAVILHSGMTHRRDLDGLRAIAALLVLGFHFDVRPLWSGGWIGGWLGLGCSSGFPVVLDRNGLSQMSPSR